jgi:hypothetical protein
VRPQRVALATRPRDRSRAVSDRVRRVNVSGTPSTVANGKRCRFAVRRSGTSGTCRLMPPRPNDATPIFLETAPPQPVRTTVAPKPPGQGTVIG